MKNCIFHKMLYFFWFRKFQNTFKGEALTDFYRKGILLIIRLYHNGSLDFTFFSTVGLQVHLADGTCPNLVIFTQ